MLLTQIILGVIQGVFEWLPISSEGIVALASQFLTKDFNPVDIALFLHLGTLFAVLIYFGKDWIKVLTFRNKGLLRFLIIATVFSLIVGYPFYQLIKNIAVGNMLLLIVGVALLFTAFFQKREKKVKINSNKLAMISGALQGLSVVPGLSRSGSTIFSLSLGKFSPSEILKISYMMSVPVVLASSFYLFLESSEMAFKYWPALIFSLLVGITTLHLLINFAKKINFFKFALFFGLLCIFGAIIGFLI